MIVVDASVAAKWIFTEENTEHARALLRSSLDREQPVVAPALLVSEVTNIIRQRMRRDALVIAEAQVRLSTFLDIPITYQTPTGLISRALAIADRYELQATYDAQYLALAELIGCPLWTDDRRLLRALGNRVSFVRWIGDYGQ